MKVKPKKGFTIVELVIVIAVIGILAAILVPTFTNLSAKAREVNDEVVAKNISTSLKIAKERIDDVSDLKEVIDSTYGDGFLERLEPQSPKKDRNFWYNVGQNLVEYTSFDEIEAREDGPRFDASFRSCLKDGYVLLDRKGSELAELSTLLETVYSRRDCDEILRQFESHSSAADAFLENLSNTLIINENGCLRGEDYNRIDRVYFTSDSVQLKKTVLFQFGAGKIDFKTISKTSPLVGFGMDGKTIELKKSMFFGTDTLVFPDGVKVILHVDTSRLEDLRDVFAASSTNGYITINGDPNEYTVLGDKLINSSTGVIVLENLGETISKSARSVEMPVTEEVNASQTVTVNNDVVANTTQIASSTVTATVPSGVAVTGDTLELSVYEKDASEANIVMDDFAIKALDVHIEGVAKNNNVPIVIDLGPALPAHLSSYGVKLYHVEEYEAVPMTRVESLEELVAHNTYYYDEATGNVAIAIKSFSEILMGASPVTKWNGTAVTKWYDDHPGQDEYTLSTAEELAGLAKLVNEGTCSFESKTIKLGSDIILNDFELGESKHTAMGMSTSATNDPAFEGNALKDDQSDKFRVFPSIGKPKTRQTFQGSFDGQEHTVSGQFGLWYDDPMHSDYLGLFGCVEGPDEDNPEVFPVIKNLTISNSFYYYYGGLIGLVTSCSYGRVDYKNIKIQKNYASQYNWHCGGIIGFLGSDSVVNLENIVVDDTNKLEALWGTYDACVGGLIGCVSITATHKPEVTIKDCDVYPVMNVYNDACANYQWFAYRYTGMLLGYLKVGDGTAESWLVNHLHCTNVMVHYGAWSDYWYYKNPADNNKPSYAAETDWKYARYEESELIRDGDGIVTGSTKIDELNSRKGQTYTARGSTFTITEDHLDNLCHLPYKQLFGGGQGFYGIDSDKYQTYMTAAGEGSCGVSESTSIVTTSIDGVKTRKLAVTGQAITLKNLTKTGYTLYKWSDGVNYYDQGDEYTVTGDVTLTALWQQKVRADITIWEFAGAVFCINALSAGDSDGLWIPMSYSSTSGFYEANVPLNHMNKIIFVRMDPAQADQEWSGMWNQTNDITDAEKKAGSYIYNVTTIGDGGTTKAEGSWILESSHAKCVFFRADDAWKKDGARTVAYFFDSSGVNTPRWVTDPADTTGNRLYFRVPEGYDMVIFTRQHGDVADWGNVWNKTADISLSGNWNRTYIVSDWVGSWQP